MVNEDFWKFEDSKELKVELVRCLVFFDLLMRLINKLLHIELQW